MIRSSCRRALAASAAILVFAGCGQEERVAEPVPTDPVPGGTCVIGMFSDFDSLNEFVSTDANATDVMENMLYMPLLRRGSDFGIEGRLAKSWEATDEGRTITMALRDDIFWHDGEPTTAEDVVFTFDRYRDPALGWPGIGSLRHIVSIEATDPHTVVFRFDRAADRKPPSRLQGRRETSSASRRRPR